MSRRKGAARKTNTNNVSGLVAIGHEVRGIARRLEVVESYVIVARMALDGQGAEHDQEIAAVLKHSSDSLLFAQIRDLENLAARCDGGEPSERNDDREDVP